MFCRHCGVEISDDSSFCSKCGKSVSGNQNLDTVSVIKHKVTLFRTSQTYLLNPPINISINGVADSSIENGGNKEFELDQGHYIFEFSASVRKAKIEVNLDRDVQITLSWNRLTGSLVAKLS